MIADLLEPCEMCRWRPERRDVIEHGADVWWLVVYECRAQIIHVVGASTCVSEPQQQGDLEALETNGRN